MAEVSDDQLREMAQHRGLKLVKSRRRKVGIGDFGKYGLTDAIGKPLLGIGEDGLTASAEDIQDYLRKSALDTWKASAETTPERPARPKKSHTPEPEEDDPPVRRLAKSRSTSTAQRKESERKAPSKPVLRLVPKTEVRPKTAPVPELEVEPPPPALRIRRAKPSDAEALADILDSMSGVSLDRRELTRNLAATRRAKGDLLVAERSEIIGCCGWAVVPTVHRGRVGRLTVLVVEKTRRRDGVGTALVAAAEEALSKAGCREIEVMSDIRIDNSHNFFRALKFGQASYRFVRSLGG